ncbi:helix-turn-helix domain-containing protein [Microbacterium enclense]|uniref:helix-turn-helix domain-containing protein n=1 Tax=Microbacterium enclense TaxID=993073 RepID=UPI0021A260F0|nr:helix-turn-helix domain-containing protein [Microbacterium enclense]MCT2087508.1 helix-turn-helix domain-containing protein [Microbacterium enclense]
MEVTAKAERSGSWWAIEVPEIPGLFTQARRLDLVPAMVVEAASLLDVDLELEDVKVDPQLPSEDADALASARRASVAARRHAAISSRVSREAVARLRGQGLSVRDVAELMHLSPQRVSAIENEERSTTAS